MELDIIAHPRALAASGAGVADVAEDETSAAPHSGQRCESCAAAADGSLAAPIAQGSCEQ